MSWCRVCGRYHLFGAARLHESRAKSDWGVVSHVAPISVGSIAASLSSA
jgi:hypothetical protein